MGATKIQIGYGSDKRGSNPKSCYGTRSSGKKIFNGGFNGAPTVDHHDIPDDKWYTAFPNSYRPSWDKLEINE